MTVEGIDVSTYQTSTPSLAGLGFVIARASYGTTRDLRYGMHAANVRAAGLVLGAYHFWYPGDGALQAAAFLAVASGADFLALDLEGAGSGTTAAQSQARAFIAACHAAGRQCGLYHSLSGYPALGQDFDWVAYWTDVPPPISWDFWQYQGSPLDRDRWRGDLASLRAFVAGTPAGGTVAIYEAHSEHGIVKVAAGVTATGESPGETWSKVKTAPGPFTAHTNELLHRIGGTSLPTNAVKMTDGPLAGLYVGLGGTSIAYTPDPVPPPLTPADVAAARAAGFAAAKAAAIKAVGSI